MPCALTAVDHWSPAVKVCAVIATQIRSWKNNTVFVCFVVVLKLKNHYNCMYGRDWNFKIVGGEFFFFPPQL